jgi:hypothetical protein
VQFAACAAAWYALGMAKRAVVRKVVKWGGLAASALLAAAWVGSCWYGVLWFVPAGGYLCLECGVIERHGPLWPLEWSGGHAWSHQPTNSDMRWSFVWGTLDHVRYASVPLWIPLLIVVGATAAAWWADARGRRRQRVGSCPACGYDRRGLEVGKVCPECGAAAGV